MRACPACKSRVAAHEGRGWWASVLRIFHTRRYRCGGCGRVYHAIGKADVEPPAVQHPKRSRQLPKDDGKLQEVVQRLREVEAQLKSDYESSRIPDDRKRNDGTSSYTLDPVIPRTPQNGDRDPEVGVDRNLGEPFTISRLRVRR